MSRVTLGVATWSGSKDYLQESLDSLDNQTFKDFVIKIDDDETKNVWDKWSDFLAIDTEFVALPAADDVYEPTWLDESVNFLRENLNCAAVFSQSYKIDEKGDRISGSFELPFENLGTYNFETMFKYMFKYGNFVEFPSGVYRTSMLRDFRFVKDALIGGAADTYGYYDILNRGWDIGIIDKKLYKNRIHNKQYSEGQRNTPGPIDHWHALDAATKLRPSVRTFDVHILLSKAIEENETRREDVRVLTKADNAKNLRLLILHEPPFTNGTGQLCGYRALDFNRLDDDWITMLVFPNPQEGASVISKVMYKNVPCITAPPKLLLEVVNRYNPAEIEIHHTLRWGLSNIKAVIDKDPGKVKVFLHDSALWCGQLHQMNNKGIYCDGPGYAKCPECLNVKPELIEKSWTSTVKTIRVAQEIIANSPWLQEQAIHFFGRDNIDIFKWPVPPLKKAFHGPKIGYFGHSGPVKGMRVLLEAARRLPDYQFVLFTDMPEAFVENRRVYGYDNVVVMGNYKREDLPKLVNLVTIVVVPSICESFGLVARECDALGKRVIATKVGGLADFGTVEGNNVDDLVLHIKAML